MEKLEAGVIYTAEGVPLRSAKEVRAYFLLEESGSVLERVGLFKLDEDK